MSDTPRTDAVAIHPSMSVTSDYSLLEIHARQLERENATLRSLLQQMLDVAENADETGYVTDAGFVDLEKLHAEVRAALENTEAEERRNG